MVLGFEVAFELAELSLDFILPVLADHFDGAQAFFCLAQFVFLLLLGASHLLNVNALVNTPTISLANSHVILMPSVGPSSSSTTHVDISEAFSVNECITTVTGSRRSLWVAKNGVIRIKLGIADGVQAIWISYRGFLSFKLPPVEHFLDPARLERVLKLLLYVQLCHDIGSGSFAANH